jgi:hypothetical protein
MPLVNRSASSTFVLPAFDVALAGDIIALFRVAKTGSVG